jgi:hypothetical protein
MSKMDSLGLRARTIATAAWALPHLSFAQDALFRRGIVTPSTGRAPDDPGMVVHSPSDDPSEHAA